MAVEAERVEDRCANLVSLLSARAALAADRIGYTFVSDDASRETALTYGELDRQARALAAGLTAVATEFERAVLLLPSGPDYVVALFACLHAGIVAVPAFPVRGGRGNPRVDAIVRDCRPALALTTRAFGAGTRAWAAGLPSPPTVIEVDAPRAETTRAAFRVIHPSDLAILQYTSGSTSLPKGVMLTHAHVVHNEVLLRDALGHTPESCWVTWLPFFHDMGLIGGVLAPFFAGFPTTVMSPAAFMHRPLLWLELISRKRATTSGAPNMAYELCARKAEPAKVEQLDLRSWDVAFSGAEPVRAETLQRFAERFAAAGFRARRFLPVFGMAEVTLLATAPARGAEPHVVHVDRAALNEGRVVRVLEGTPGSRTFVGCGAPCQDTRLAIVDPRDKQRCDADVVGEVWLSGRSVAQGYFGAEHATQATFGEKLPDGSGPFLRTGDLGFYLDGHLFLVGRLKNMLIVGGENFYAEDLEHSFHACHPALRAESAAAFAVDDGAHERLIVAAEVERNTERAALEQVCETIRRRIAEDHGIAVSAIRLLRRGAIPKTTSGKIQRAECRDAFAREAWKVVFAWDAAAAEPAPDAPASALDGAALTAWLTQQVAHKLALSREAISTAQLFNDLGLESKDLVALAEVLSSRLRRPVPVSSFYDHPSIDDLVRALMQPDRQHTTEVSWRPTRQDDAIAVVGMSCRFPGAPDLAAFWDMLHDGRSAIVEVPQERWSVDEHYDPDPQAAGKSVSRWGGFLETAQLRGFDPYFFGIPPNEARHMDPQQRLLLEVVWEALADAGTPPDSLSNTRTGVFVGATHAEYAWLSMSRPEEVGPFSGTGASLGVLANRISYLLNTKGASLTIDTICSSALVALHLACQQLRAGDCSLALVSAVNLMLTPGPTLALSKLGVLAPDGKCKPFDASADGIVRGEGAGCVVLKPLSRARADADRIYAVVRGSAINQDGRTNGIAAPNGLAQEMLLREAYARAGVRGCDVQYVETHGTGTVLGDPIEAGAIGRVAREGRPAGQPCYIGSVKANLGHLEAAGGLASFIKTALALQRDVLPQSLNFRTPNPHIDFDAHHIAVARERMPWPRGQAPGLAGVTALSFGGTNVHVVLESAAAPSEPAAVALSDGGYVMFPISAHSRSALASLAGRQLAALSAQQPPALRDIAHTAAVRRAHGEWRAAFAARSLEEARAKLRQVETGSAAEEIAVGRARPGSAGKVAFLYSGQGSQWVGMARALSAEQPQFRDTLTACAHALQPFTGWSLLDYLELPADAAEHQRVDVVQPMLWAMQVSLSALYRAWGLVPHAVLGHSLGEVSAACVAGALPLEAGAKVIATRSRLVRSVSGRGGMAVVELSRSQLETHLREQAFALAIAAESGPSSCVVSGESAPLERLLTSLSRSGVYARRIQVDYASHSPVMDPLLSPLVQALGELPAESSHLPFYSTVTGGRLEQPLDAAYWARNLRQPVLLWSAINALAADGVDTVIELSPHPVLLPSLEGAVPAGRSQPLVLLESLRRSDGGTARAMRALCELYIRGHRLDFSAQYPGRARPVALPAYAFERESFAWRAAPSGESSPARSFASARHPMLLRSLPVAGDGDTLALWEADLSVERFPYLSEHAVEGTAVIPSAVYLELLEVAARQWLGPRPHRFQNIEIATGLFLLPGSERTAQIVLRELAQDEFGFRICSRARDATAGSAVWVEHVRGTLAILPEVERASPVERSDIQALGERCRTSHSVEGHYLDLAARGMQWGPSFRGILSMKGGDCEAVGWIELPEHLRDAARGYLLHPGLLDAGLQVIVATQMANAGGGADPFLMNRLGSYRVHRTPPKRMFVHCSRAARFGENAFGGDIQLYDEHGRLVLEALGMHLQRLGGESTLPASESDAEIELYREVWEALPATPEEACAAAHNADPWLIISDEHGFSRRLSAACETLGQRCVLIECGPEFRRLGPASFALDCRSEAHVDALMETLADRAGQVRCRGILYARALPPFAAPAHHTRPAQTIEELSEQLALFTAFAGALAASRYASDLRVFVISAGASRAEPASVQQAAIASLARVFATEAPDHWGGSIDLDAASAEDAVAALARHLPSAGGERLVRLSPGGRSRARLRRWNPPGGAPELVLSPSASYLVTGGLGGVGRATALRLAERGAKHLVLVGRHAREADLTSAARRSLDQLRERGVRLQLAALDVCDESALQALREQLFELGVPALRGIIHGAGVLETSAFELTERAQFERALAPKLAGAQALARVFASEPLDFFVLMSSATAVFGSAGVAAYAAANAALEAFAQSLCARGVAASCIHWGLWRDTGMANHERARLASQGVEALAPERALDSLERVIVTREPCALALKLDWSKVPMRYSADGGDLPLFDATLWPEERAGGPATCALDTFEAVVASVLAAVCRCLEFPIERLDPQRSLLELGASSLHALMIRDRVQHELGVRLPITALLQGPTPARLAEQVWEARRKSSLFPTFDIEENKSDG